jgi:hypothetical protein
LEFWWCEFPTKKQTQNSLALHQIDSLLSYLAFYMHRIGIYGLLVMTLGGGWYWQFLASKLRCGLPKWFDSNLSRSAANWLQLLILRISYAWHWHICVTDNKLVGLMVQITWISVLPWWVFSLVDPLTATHIREGKSPDDKKLRIFY